MKVSTTSLSSNLSILQQRIIRTLRGAFIADAASMGLHWIYNPDDVLDKLNNSLHNTINAPEFINPPIPNYYSTKEFPNHYLYGMLSPYGEQLLYITQYIAEREKSDDTSTTPSTVTELDGNTMMNGLYEWGTTFGGRPDHALTTVISNIETIKKEKEQDDSTEVIIYPNCGADDDQAHFYMKLIPVVCRYISETTTTSSSSDDDDLLLLQNVEISIRIHQNNDIAVAFGIAATRILQSILLLASTTSSSSTTTSNLLQILDTVYENLEIDLKKVFDNNTNMIDSTKKDEIIQLVLQSYKRGKTAATEYTTLNDFLLILSNEKMKDQYDNPFYNLAARSCALPGSFIGPMYLFYKIALSNTDSNNDSNIIDDNTYINAIRENILAAGDTCSRGIFIGAVLGAAMSSSSTTNDTSDNDDVVTFDTLWNKVEINTRNEIDLYSTKIAKVE